ncbi:MAG: hypothetical protein J7J30_01535 [Candidatus Odinarchaeota archaeon]|nr:hypothetical protein [Candidatus Odinarchaeota archaeon]
MNNSAKEELLENVEEDLKELREEAKIIVELQKLFLQILRQLTLSHQININENLIKNLENFLKDKEEINEELFRPVFQELKKLLDDICALRDSKQKEMAIEKEFDKWRIVSSTKKLIEKFSPSYDVSIPTFFFEAIKAVHRHEIPEELREKIVKKLSLEIRSLIQEMFIKDPYMGLLKKVKDKPVKLEEKELKAINNIVRERIDSLIYSLKNVDRNWKDSILSAQFSLEAFNWGSAKTEKRFLQLFYQKAKRLVESINDETKLENKILNAETATLICELTNQLLKVPKLRMKIEEMKSKI